MGLGLFCLGVPYALMWGLLAGVLRFIPYVGPVLGALMPIALSMAVFTGWMKPLLVGGLFVLLEIATNALLEPLLYGRGAGVSADEVALQMLQKVLDPRQFETEVTKVGMLAAEVLSLVEQSAPTLVCIGMEPPGGFAQTRYLCKRLRARFPTFPIVVGCWGDTQDEAEILARLRLDNYTQAGTRDGFPAHAQDASGIAGLCPRRRLSPAGIAGAQHGVIRAEWILQSPVFQPVAPAYLAGRELCRLPGRYHGTLCYTLSLFNRTPRSLGTMCGLAQGEPPCCL